MGDRKRMTPLSGEIMAGGAARAGTGPSARDAVDADFITLPKGAPAVEPQQSPPRREHMPANATIPTGLDVLVVAAVGGSSQRAGIGFWSAGTLAVLAAFWMSGGHSLSRHFPLIRGEAEQVRIAELSSRVAETATGPRLFIDGEVRNVAGDPIASPNLTIDVTANDGIVTRYRLATGAGPMSDGERRRFSSRLAAPEAGVRTVAVAVDRKGRD